MKEIMLAILMISPNLATLDVDGGPYFVTAGQFDYGKLREGLPDRGINDTRYTFAGGGINYKNARFGVVTNDRLEPEVSTPVQGYIGYDYPISESASVSYRQVINCAEVCGYNERIDDIGVSAVSLSITF